MCSGRLDRLQREGAEVEAGAGAHLLARRDDDGFVGQRMAVERGEVIGGCENLQGPGDIQELDLVERDDFDPTERVWHETRAHWQSCQSLSRYRRSVNKDASP